MAEYIYEGDRPKQTIRTIGHEFYLINDTLRTMFAGTRKIPFSDIKEAELIVEDGVKVGAAAGLGTVGLLLAGPVGLAIGAGVGALSGKAICKVTMADDRVLVMELKKSSFKELQKYLSIQAAVKSLPA